MRPRHHSLLMVLCAHILTAAAIAQERPAWPKLAPYPAMRWQDDAPHVLIDGAWHELTAIDAHPVADILDFCRRAYGNSWQKRFSEDLVQVMGELGQPVGGTVDLALRDPLSGVAVTKHAVPMTKENRTAIWSAREEAGRARDVRLGDPAIPRTDRAHAAPVPDHLRPLAARLFDADAAQRLSRAQAEEDLDQLEWLLDHAHSYAAFPITDPPADYRAALDAVRAGLADGITLNDFTLGIARALAPIGDGHARVSGLSRLLPRGCAPFTVAFTGPRPIALAPGGGGFLDEGHPVLRSIDGLPLERWLDAAARTIPRGSPQLIRRRAVERLTFTAYLRRELGLPDAPEVSVELASPDGARTLERSFPLAPTPVPPPDDDGISSRILDGNTGLLRIGGMSSEEDARALAAEHMRRLRGTDSLIIDVRGNGGGSRDLLLAFLPYFLPDAPPLRILNVGAYRIPPGEPADNPDGYLANRFLFPITAPIWSDEDRAALRTFAETFTPIAPQLPPGFSAWHYLAARPFSAHPAPAPAPDGFRYAGPVAVLLDDGCFSATDIFLGAFKGLPGVTLIGTPSGGGSGRVASHRLAHSGLSIVLSTMVSCRPDGTLYDGRGVHPDLLAEPTPTDLIGRTDSVLDAAIQRLRGAPRPPAR